MITSIKFFNTHEDKILQTTVSTVDKCYQKNDLFFITSNKTSSILEEVDKSIWTFAQLKFIPHALTTDNEYKTIINKHDVFSLLSYNFDDILTAIQKPNLTQNILIIIINFNYSKNDEIFSDFTELETYFTEQNISHFNNCKANINFVVISKTDEKTQINTAIENTLKIVKSLDLPHEIWKNFDFGWEKVL